MGELSPDPNQERQARLARLNAVVATEEQAGREGPLVAWYKTWKLRVELIGGDTTEQVRFEFVAAGLDAYLFAREIDALDKGIDHLATAAAYKAAEQRYIELTGEATRADDDSLSPKYQQFLLDSSIGGREDATLYPLQAVCNLQLRVDRPFQI